MTFEETFERKIKEYYKKWAIEKVGNSFECESNWRGDMVLGFITFILKGEKQLHDEEIKKINDIMTFCCREKDKQIQGLQSIGYLRKCALEIEEKDNRIKELGIKIDKLTNINTELQAENEKLKLKLKNSFSRNGLINPRW